MKNQLLKEVFLIRPDRQMDFRYAGGKWLPDDGKPDLAFIHSNVATYVGLPYQDNILWSWMDGDLAKNWIKDKSLSRYYNVNPWHYQTIDNEDWGDHRWDRDKHPNEIAGRSAMDYCCKLHSCANGRGVEIHQDNWFIQNGRIWIQRTGVVLKAPTNPVCFLCLDNGKGHMLKVMRSHLSDYEGNLEYAKEDYEKAVIKQNDSQYDIELYGKKIKNMKRRISRMR